MNKTKKPSKQRPLKQRTRPEQKAAFANMRTTTALDQELIDGSSTDAEEEPIRRTFDDFDLLNHPLDQFQDFDD